MYLMDTKHGKGKKNNLYSFLKEKFQIPQFLTITNKMKEW